MELNITRRNKIKKKEITFEDNGVERYGMELNRTAEGSNVHVC